MKQFTFKPWLMALFIAAFCLCAVLPGLHVRASEFSPYGSESYLATQEVSLIDQPENVSYVQYSDGYTGEHYAWYTTGGYTEEMAIRVQLENVTNPSPVSVCYYNYAERENSDPLQFDSDGCALLPSEAINSGSISLIFYSTASATVQYSVQVFAEASCTTLLAQSSLKTIHFNRWEEYPRFQYGSQRISGDKGELIAFEVPLVQAGFLEGKSAQLQFQVSLDDDSGFTLYGADGTPLTQNEQGYYVYPIASLASGSYAFSVSSSADCKGWLKTWMYDGEGNSLSTSADQYPITIPANYSPVDLSVLKAIADANSGNDQLKELYYNGGYKTSSNVTWDYNQTPHRLTYLAIEDYQKLAITNLDLSGLDALTSLYINGAKNLTSLNLSALTQLQYVTLYGNGLQWGDVTLPSSIKNLEGYTNVDIQGNMGPIYAKAGVETTIDLSQYIKRYGSDCTFTWKELTENSYEESNTEAVTADTAQPGVFHLTGVDGYTYCCLIKHADYKNWCLRTSDIKVTGSGTAEVKFSDEPSPISYTSIYDNQGDDYARFSISDMPTSNFKVRVQLTDSQNQNGTWFTANNETLSLSEGGCWLPASVVYQQSTNRYGFYFRIHSANKAEVGYTVSIYASEDLSVAPLATSSEKKVVFINSDNYPRVGNLPRLSGELNTGIPLTFSIQPNYLFGKPAKVRIHFNISSGFENLGITGEGWTEAIDQYQTYEYSTSNLQTLQFTLSVIAKAAVSGTYSVNLTDGDGNYIGFTSDDGIVQIPLNLSDTDKQALIALRDANKMSNDLYNFIDKGIYLKDTDRNGSSQNVGVRWNSASPGRVEMFFIKDYQSRAVTSLNLKPLTALKEIYISGTNLSKLNLSGLTLRQLYLWDTKLKWSDVQLPNWDEDWHYLGGNTWIQIGTPLDDYNSVAANGTEIDLSEYASFAGEASTFTWYKDTGTLEGEKVTFESTAAGKFILSGQPGEKFYGEIAHPQYGYWTMRTSTVQIQRNASDFNTADIAGLKKLATDNPDVTALQDFVNSKGWEIDNWNGSQDQVRTQWDSNNRLTHLRIRLNRGQKPDTISTLDLSAFAELKYFECERWLNIKELDLTNNTKLEHLHIYSRNLETIDASKLSNLQVFKFATESSGEWPPSEYPLTKLTTLNLKGCTKLQTLKLEHAHLTALNLADFPNLNYLRIENCQDLQTTGIEALKNLSIVELPNTTIFQTWINNLPTSVTELWLQDTEYTLPASTSTAVLKGLGLPNTVSSIDLNDFPNLTSIDIGSSKVRYSTVSNWRDRVYFRSTRTRIELQSPSHPNEQWHFENGDTIDLSSEAMINGVRSKFIWVNAKNGTEEKGALQEVPDKPGVFVLNSQEADYGEYYCIIMNTQFCEVTEINIISGWQMEAGWIYVDTKVPVTYHEGDVQALANLVNNANNAQLSKWWSSNAWQTGEYVNDARAIWNNENPRRLTGLWINTSVGESADLSAFDKLEEVSLTYNNKVLTKLTLPKETQNLRGLMLEGNQALTSLIVAPYSNLNHLNVNSTGLTACDVSQNKQLTELFMRWTEIPDVEETAPAIAKQLTAYGASDVTDSIDLDNFPALKQFYPNMYMRYSDVKHPRQMDSLNYMAQTDYYCGNDVYHPRYTPIGKTFDLTKAMAEDNVTSTPVWEVVNYATDEIIRLDAKGTSLLLDEQKVKPENLVVATVYNSLFPNWQLRYNTWVYTTDGDVNLDRKVNVQDVTGMVSCMLDSWPWEKQRFGWAESNTNYNDTYAEAADLVGIVNIILNKPVTKGSELRAAYMPQVEMNLDDRNFLQIDNEKPIAALYLKFAGATQELPLLNEAARLIQSSSLKDDTLRIVAYSLDGKTITSGLHNLVQLTPGMQLLEASFSDAKAVPMELKGDYMPTANEVIAPISEEKAVYNYPNPAAGSTTFCYTLNEAVQQVEIQLFASNGAMVARLQGLSAEQGRHEETMNLPFASGVYYYRLVVDGKQLIATNTLIIK